MALNKLKGAASPLTESLDPHFVEKIIDTLFPVGNLTPLPGGTFDWEEEEMGVTEGELRDAVRRIKSGRAPGPDGVHGKLWGLACLQIEGARQLYNSCLKEGKFPPAWKEANIILLPKEGKPKESPSAYRPICLLDEAGKVLERIIARRLVEHLARRGPDLHGGQYGFRPGRSTVDAIGRVRSVAGTVTEGGGVLLAVSLDISNAFNTLPWSRISEALDFHRVPGYLAAIIRDYFRDRKIIYVDRLANVCARDVYCGVPQGSVLGPLLWNLTYDVVLRTALPPGCTTVCYADDTLILAGGKDWGEAKIMAELATARVVRSIKDLGLKVAPQKTEAVYFYGGRRGAPPRTEIMVEETPVVVGAQIKYLGLHLDGRWTFREHFARLAPRVERAAMALCRLLPNLGGPDSRVRGLYAGIIHSMVLYGSPIWAEKLEATRMLRQKMLQLQKRVANRVCRGYRTVSWAAVGVMAGVPPLNLLAGMHSDVYWRVRRFKEEGRIVTAADRRAVRVHARRSVMEKWLEILEDPGTPGRRTVGAIGPCLPEWVDRAKGGVSYRMAQVLTGHGCFGDYLCRIGKERTTRCAHCGHGRDDAQHTLDVCAAWNVERGELVSVVGADLSLPAVVAAAVGSEECWKAFSSFCEKVMSQKEEKEREREQTGRRRRSLERDDEEDDNDGGNVPPDPGSTPAIMADVDPG